MQPEQFRICHYHGNMMIGMIYIFRLFIKRLELCAAGHLEQAQTLFKSRKVRPDQKDRFNKTPLDWVLQSPPSTARLNLLQLFIKADIDPLRQVKKS